jgi:hypothetical protein
MAKVVRDPHEHPDAIAPDLTKPDPLLTFTKDDVAFVYGSRWKQRYFKKWGTTIIPYLRCGRMAQLTRTVCRATFSCRA